MVVWPLTEALPIWGALCVASTAQGSCVLGVLGEEEAPEERRQDLVRVRMRRNMRPDPGARGGGRKRGAPCIRVGSPLVSTCVPSSQRGSLTGSHRGIVGMAAGKCRPRATNRWTEAALAESRSPQRCWIWVNVAL